MNAVRRALGLLVAILALALLHAGAATAAVAPPGAVHLALGDSVAFGYQEALLDRQVAAGAYDAAAFTGYVDRLSQRLALLRPGLRTVNLSCPGETVASYAEGACPFHEHLPLHDDYPREVPQAAAALAFLRAHPGQVDPITISLGANDLLRLFDDCERELTCVLRRAPERLEDVGRGLDRVLADLRAAAPDARIILLGYYNPFAVLALTNPVAQALNETIATAAAAHGARVADVFAAFSLAPQPTTTCALTLVCTRELDIHPTAAGHDRIAEAFYASFEGAVPPPALTVATPLAGLQVPLPALGLGLQVTLGGAGVHVQVGGAVQTGVLSVRVPLMGLVLRLGLAP